jgi:hypothetical protein
MIDHADGMNQECNSVISSVVVVVFGLEEEGFQNYRIQPCTDY